VVAESQSNTLLLSANPRYFEQIKALIEELDKPQQQVLIQVLLAEVTLDQGRDLGLEWTYKRHSLQRRYRSQRSQMDCFRVFLRRDRW
jgi:type II secretory pathway component GspD/PulD (secretin)